MRPALKFLKHAPRGLKHLKHTIKHHAHHGKGIEPQGLAPTTGEAGRFTGMKRMIPLRFKSRN